MKKIIVNSLDGEYSVLFIDNLSSVLRRLIEKHKCHLLIDNNILKLNKEIFKNKKDYVSFKSFNAVEENKTIAEITAYIKYLLKNDIHKDHKLIVVGGGLIQDIGSFTAKIILRGIEWIFIPTTLLSMSDSCIGSKSGINVAKYKNQVGAFHPPVKIYICTKFLNTLPSTEILNGIGEIIKHIFISGGEIFNYVNRNINKLPNDQRITQQIIYKSLLIKKEIIEEDEFEKNIRKLLNYGHTFGHALEGYTNHKIPHGIGVLIGMDIANYISLKRKLINKKMFEKMHSIIKPYIKNYKVKIKNYNLYMKFLSHDKKVVGDSVLAILSRGIGKIKIIKIKLDNNLLIDIKEYFKELQI